MAQNNNDIVFSTEYNPVGKPAEYAHANKEEYAFVDANSVSGNHRVKTRADLLTIPDDILRNIGFIVTVLSDNKDYRLDDWDKRRDTDFSGWKDISEIDIGVGNLNTQSKATLSPLESESFSTSINLHEISKTGSQKSLIEFSKIFKYSRDINSSEFTSKDLNNLVSPGMYYNNNQNLSWTNNHYPSQYNCNILVYSDGANVVSQICMDINNKIYFRSRNDSWSTWIDLTQTGSSDIDIFTELEYNKAIHNLAEPGFYYPNRSQNEGDLIALSYPVNKTGSLQILPYFINGDRTEIKSIQIYTVLEQDVSPNPQNSVVNQYYRFINWTPLDSGNTIWFKHIISPATGNGTTGSLNTSNSTSLSVNSNESFSGSINLHKISKTGNVDDLISTKESINWIPIISDSNKEVSYKINKFGLVMLRARCFSSNDIIETFTVGNTTFPWELWPINSSIVSNEWLIDTEYSVGLTLSKNDVGTTVTISMKNQLRYSYVAYIPHGAFNDLN